MKLMKKQVSGEGMTFGNIMDVDDLKENLAENCVPEEFMDMDVTSYSAFLEQRRVLMAAYIRDYYEHLD